MPREFKSGLQLRFTALETGETVELLFDEKELAQIRGELSLEILRDYLPRFQKQVIPERVKFGQKGKLIALTVLNGAQPFSDDMTGLLEKDLVFERDSIRLSSYGSGTQSSGKVEILKDMRTQITKDDEILVFEDIVDTGLTMEDLIKILVAKGAKPENIKVCALLSKPSRRTHEVAINYLGADIPNRYVFGYGLDADEKYRDLPYVAAFPEQNPLAQVA